jgi:hypothetical protein
MPRRRAAPGLALTSSHGGIKLAQRMTCKAGAGIHRVTRSCGWGTWAVIWPGPATDSAKLLKKVNESGRGEADLLILCTRLRRTHLLGIPNLDATIELRPYQL